VVTVICEAEASLPVKSGGRSVRSIHLQKEKSAEPRAFRGIRSGFLMALLTGFHMLLVRTAALAA
jgi:uncharacterized membrane protein